MNILRSKYRYHAVALLKLVLCVMLGAGARCDSRAEIIDENGAKIPVIDIHTHVFNCRDLPLEGILNARGVWPRAAKALAKVLNTWTPTNDLDNPLEQQGLFAADVVSLAGTVSQHKRLKDILNDDERNELAQYAGVPLVIPSSAASSANQQSAPPVAATKLEPIDDIGIVAAALRNADFPPSEDSSTPAPAAFAPTLNKVRTNDMHSEGLKGYVDFLGVMTKGNLRVAQRLTAEYPEVDLFVHHMMDMGNAYADHPAMSFEEQMTRMTKLDKRFNGHFLHFVAFDPFRRKDALDEVNRGISAGAVGVKFYPPSGYRATANEIPERPASKAEDQKRWDSRYGNSLTGAQLDEFNEGLFAYCEANDLPIFTHCTPGGFESVKGYGKMASPEFWQKVLERHKRLRLCFGHSGGETYWFNNGEPHDDSYSFTEKVIELTRRYENVYCEVGYCDRILGLTDFGPAAARFAAEFGKNVSPGEWAFGDKLMYGTDWHMIYKERNHSDYLERFAQLFSHPSIKKWRVKFFGKNAANFLKLSKVAEATQFSQAQRNYWKAIVQKTTDAGEKKR